MITLGVDPGTLHLGWGVVGREANRLYHVDHGVVHLKAGDSMATRLCRIAEELEVILERHRPAVGSVETLFFHRDPQAASKLGHARGVVLLCLGRAGVEVAEYAPALVKKCIVGHGRAEKTQVALMVRALLGLSRPPPSDAGDALALAITHLRLGRQIPAVRAEGRARARATLRALSSSAGRRRGR